MLASYWLAVRSYPARQAFSTNIGTEELSSNAAVDAAAKPAVVAPVKKKRKATRALKITNTHMRDQVRPDDASREVRRLMSRVSTFRKITCRTHEEVRLVLKQMGILHLFFTASRSKPAFFIASDLFSALPEILSTHLRQQPRSPQPSRICWPFVSCSPTFVSL